MLKKILYIIVSIVLGFIVFFISWRDSYSRAVVNRGLKALEEENYEFFNKFLDYYEKESLFTVEYTEGENTTKIIGYNVFSKNAKDKDDNKVNRSGIQLLVLNVNMDIIKIDEEEPSADQTLEDEVSKVTITGNTGSTYSAVISTYGYDETPIIIYTFPSHETKEDLVNDTYTEAPTTLTHLKFEDSVGTVFFDCDVNIDLTEYNEEEYWQNLVNEGKAGVAFTPKEVRTNFTFAFPEMKRTILITAVTLLIEIGLGLFIFWPKKSYVPTEEVDRETYTFASTEEKEKYALAKVARGKKEKEDRENRYKNVRKETNLEDLSKEAIEESMDKENTCEAALEADALEEAKEENNEVVENSEVIEENETIEEKKEEE